MKFLLITKLLKSPFEAAPNLINMDEFQVLIGANYYCIHNNDDHF